MVIKMYFRKQTTIIRYCHGIPQSRHRVILFGIRSDVASATNLHAQRPDSLLLAKVSKKVGVSAALAGLPPLRSRLSKEPDSQKAWIKALREAPLSLKGWRLPVRGVIEAEMEKFLFGEGATRPEGYVEPGSPGAS